MKPFEYNELRNSKKYISILKTSKEYREDQIRYYEEWRERFVLLDKMIKAELKKQ